MNPNNLTQEQVADIKERSEKGLDALTALNLVPAAQVVPAGLGNNVFANQVIPYLADTKYPPKEEVTEEASVTEVIPSNDPEVNPNA